MTQITLERFRSDDKGTFGVLMLNGKQLCFTAEPAPTGDHPCIPSGTYNCINYSSPKFPDVWQVCNVPGRQDILIHNGNDENDTHGCILVGDSQGIVDGLPAVLNSRATLLKLKQELPDIFTLTISN